jgi:hypothetical protein
MAKLTTAQVAELMSTGMDAYQRGDIATAKKCLLDVTDREPDNWRAKLYLAMSYCQTGDRLLAVYQLRYLLNNCCDAEIKERAKRYMEGMQPESDRAPIDLGIARSKRMDAPTSMSESGGTRRRVQYLVNSTTGTKFRLFEVRTTIGRDGHNHIRLTDDPSAAQFQATVFRDGEEFFIEASISMRPTRLNGEAVSHRMKLRIGDTIEVGKTIFRVE